MYIRTQALASVQALALALAHHSVAYKLTETHAKYYIVQCVI